MKNKKWWLFAFIFCLVLATLSPLASSSPDGLEKVADDNGIVNKTATSPFHVIADYVFPGIHNEALATILAGWLGTTLIFILVFGVTWIIIRMRITKSLPAED
jgi:hypothetical protein